MRAFLLLSLVLLALFAEGSSARSLGRGIPDEPPDAAVDLNSTNFASALVAAPARFAIVEFFAHWCPACRNYKPQYEKVARIFNGPGAAHPGHVFMARVDCALKMNKELCDRFSINHFPMLFWSQPKKLVSAHWKPDAQKTEIQVIDDARTAERLLDWINKQLGSSFTLEDQKYGSEDILPYKASDPEEIARAIYDVEEATAYALDIILSHKMITAETRASLITFLQLLTLHHPSKSCRGGSADILVNFGDWWPSDSQLLFSSVLHGNHENDIKNIRICGKDVPRGYWIFCHGSRNDTRGFSCGLWVLFHALSVRVEDGESHSTFLAIRDFVHNFFICEECRQHFYAMCSQVTAPFRTSRELSLWFWSTHNKVNERLRKEESVSKSGDPRFPKMMWPTRQLCPLCYSSSSENVSILTSYKDDDWNKDEVYKFLVKYYGKILISSFKKDEFGVGFDEQVRQAVHLDDDGRTNATNAVTVPVGAAVGIALASCAFGALAWFWRAQQKNRKYLNHLHSLKNT